MVFPERTLYSLKIVGIVSGVIGIIATILCYVSGYNPMEKSAMVSSGKVYNYQTTATTSSKAPQPNLSAVGTRSPYSEFPKGPNVLFAASFGAKGDGVTDDTDALQRMVDAIPDTGGEAVIPAGIYLVDAVKSIRLKSNIALYMSPETVLKAIPNGSVNYAVVQIADIQNVKIFGGIISGERDEHKGVKGEWGMGVRITGARQVLVQGTVAKNCWGDGFYIGTGNADSPSENIALIDIQADNNRRQGISLISGRNIEIIRPRLTNTHGTPPGAGLDIEPNRSTNIVENIQIIDPYTAGNAEGIVVALKKMNGTRKPISIKIMGHLDEGSGRGMLISSDDAIVPGFLRIENPRWIQSKKNGLSIQNHDHRSFAIDIKEPRIVDANRSGSKSAATGSAIAIYHFTGRLGVIGNVSITNPMITDTGDLAQTLSAFYISNGMGQEIQAFSITNPEFGGIISRSIPEKLQKYITVNH